MRDSSKPSLRSAGLLSWVSYLLLLVVVFAGIALGRRLVGMATGTGAEVRVALPRDLDFRPFDSAPLPAGATLEPAPFLAGTLSLPDVGFGTRLLAGSGSLLAVLSLVAGAIVLRRVLLSIEQGRPFDPRNPRRIVILAALVVVGISLVELLDWIGGRAALSSVGLDPHVAEQPISGPAPFVGLLVGLVVLACAEAFRRGRRLTEDTDGLV